MDDLLTRADKALEKSDPALARYAHLLIPQLTAEIRGLTKLLSEAGGNGCGTGRCESKSCQAAGAEPQAPAGSSPAQGDAHQCGLPGVGSYEDIKEHLAELNPEALLADGLEGALIGYTLNHHIQHCAVYDYRKCVRILMDRDGMDEDGAEEFLGYNTLGAFVGEHGPIFVCTWGQN